MLVLSHAKPYVTEPGYVEADESVGDAMAACFECSVRCYAGDHSVSDDVSSSVPGS